MTIDFGAGKAIALVDPSNVPSRAAFEKAVEDAGFTLVKLEMPE